MYSRNSFRSEAGEWRDRWLEREADGEYWRVRDTLRGAVDFERANFFAISPAEVGHDFVFRRNLLIYFDVVTQGDALRRLRGQLAPDGLLFVGHVEAAVALREGFSFWPVPRAFAFTSGAPRKLPSPPPRAPAARPVPVAAPKPVFAAPAASVAASLDEAHALADRG